MKRIPTAKRTAKTESRVVKSVRCAIYTRKSTEEGLEQEFNSLDAQREAGEAYICSQSGEGWTLIETRYDDGGYTGGNTERPALQRLMADIEAGMIDVVVVYKVDRLSRSLLDFAQLVNTFETHHVSFVSVTQQFNSATIMGRLVLNVLLSFAQFEREIISERTRDKIAATRRKGKWTGGHPLLGYDVDPVRFQLVVNPDEAERVRQIFTLYLEHESLLPVVEELHRRNWVGKRWVTRKGPERGGQPFTRTSLYRLLTNVVYTGKVRYKSEIHDGEHSAIVDSDRFHRVQTILHRNGSTGGARVRNSFGSLLKGLLRCTPCDCAMTPTHTTRSGRRYRYYLCSHAQKMGWTTCPSKSLPAAAIEAFVVERIRGLGRDPGLLRDVLTQVREKTAARIAEWDRDQRVLEKDLHRWHAEVRNLSIPSDSETDPRERMSRLADRQERIRTGEQRMTQIRDELQRRTDSGLSESDAAQTLAAFDPVWDHLTPTEQTQAIQLLIESVAYDGRNGQVTVAFHPTGIPALSDHLAPSSNRTENR